MGTWCVEVRVQPVDTTPPETTPSRRSETSEVVWPHSEGEAALQEFRTREPRILNVLM